MSKRRTPIAKDLPKHFANGSYRRACTEPLPWLTKARELRRSADLVWNLFASELQAFSNGGDDNGEPFTGSVAMMLYGFVFENLLKAGHAAKGVAIKADGNFALKGHTLEDFADELPMTLSAEERELLERLENFLVWAGRYPIPLYAQDLYPRSMADGSKAVLYGISSGDRMRIDTLITRIEAVLPTEDEALESYVRNSGA